MSVSDRNFDDLVDRFGRNIYGSAKGEVRLAVVWQHLVDVLPQLEQAPPLTVLDAGCGFGQFGLRLAQLGHQVALNDVSQNMVEAARAQFAEAGLAAQFYQQPVQALHADELGRFELLLFHAVLEWLAEPRQTLQDLFDLVAPGGHMSLMFYNKDALIYRNLMRGNWRWVENGDFMGEDGGLTPYHPLSLAEVEGWLAEWGLEVVSRAGVRAIYDYMERRLRDGRPVEEVVRIEMKYARQEPYLHLGRYLHLIVRKPLR